MGEMPISRRRVLMAGALFAGGTGIYAMLAQRPTSRADRMLVGVIGEDPPTLNPAVSTVGSCLEASAPVYNGLLHMAPDGTLTPDLAEGWEATADSRTFTFRLRRGVRWHDGRPFTAADVQFSIEELLSKLHPMGRAIYRFLDRVDCPDPMTAVVRLVRPYPALLSSAFAFWPMLPRHLWEHGDVFSNPHARAPVGTGPYRFERYAAGDHISYTRNLDYHRPGQPYFDALTLSIIPSAAGQSLAFENRDVDFLHASALPAPDLERLVRIPDAQLAVSRILGASYLAVMNTRSPMLRDVRVRRAIAHAVDRAFIRDSVLPIISEASVGPLWPASSLYDRTLVDYAFDPARAIELLELAGHRTTPDNPSRFSLRLLFAASDIRVSRMADIVAENLRQVGIDVRLEPLDRATLIQRADIAGEFDMMIETFALGPDPDFGTERLYNSANIRPLPFQNASAYANPAVDRLFEAQRNAPDRAARTALYGQIQRLIWADMPILPLASYGVACLIDSSSVSGFGGSWIGAADDLRTVRPSPIASLPLSPKTSISA